jgi:hypothetical protein
MSQACAQSNTQIANFKWYLTIRPHGPKDRTLAAPAASQNRRLKHLPSGTLIDLKVWCGLRLHIPVWLDLRRVSHLRITTICRSGGPRAMRRKTSLKTPIDVFVGNATAIPSTGTGRLSIALSTTGCEKPRAPPPDSASPIRGHWAVRALLQSAHETTAAKRTKSSGLVMQVVRHQCNNKQIQ